MVTVQVVRVLPRLTAVRWPKKGRCERRRNSSPTERSEPSCGLQTCHHAQRSGEEVPANASFNASTANYGYTPHWIFSSSDAISMASIEPGQGFKRHTVRAR